MSDIVCCITIAYNRVSRRFGNECFRMFPNISEPQLDLLIPNIPNIPDYF